MFNHKKIVKSNGISSVVNLYINGFFSSNMGKCLCHNIKFKKVSYKLYSYPSLNPARQITKVRYKQKWKEMINLSAWAALE
jgi:hypothetical protein